MRTVRWARLGAVALVGILTLSALMILPASLAVPQASAPIAASSGSATELAAAEDASGANALSISKVPLQDVGVAEQFLGTLSSVQISELDYIAATGQTTGYTVLSLPIVEKTCALWGIACGLTAINWWSVGTSALGGCLVGGAIGAVGDGIGAAPGCALGAIVAAASNIYGQQQASSQQNSEEEEMLASLTQTTLNQVNETGAFLANAFSELNATQYFMDTVADAAAEEQIDNTTFNSGLVLAQTPLGYYINSLLTPFEASLGDIWNYEQAWMAANYAPGAQFHYGSGSYSVKASTSSIVGCWGAFSSGCPDYHYNVTGGVALSITSSTNVLYIPTGASFYAACEDASSLTSIDGLTSGWQLTLSSGTYNVAVNNTTRPSDYYTLTNPHECTIYGFGVLPLSGASDFEAGSAYGMAVYICDDSCSGAGQWESYEDLGGAEMMLEMCATSSQTDCGPSYGYPGVAALDPFSAFWAPFNQIATDISTALSTARVYWGYLRGLGYGAGNPVPPNCVIPMPSFALPPEVADGVSGLSTSQLMGLYESWLNGIATFFDTPPNATSFCSGHPVYSGPGDSPYGYDVNITGYVYVPGETWDGDGFVSGSPNYGNVSRWSINGTSPFLNGTKPTAVYLTAWPTEATVNLTVGKVNAIPSNDPLVVIAIQFYAYLTLRGNGTDVPLGPTELTPAANNTPGDAIYVSSCTINGTVETSTCQLTFATIQTVVGNVSCPTNSNGACQPTSSGGGSFFGGLGDVCSWIIVDYLCSLFGGASGLVNGILQFVILIVVVVAIIYVAVWAVGRKKNTVTVEERRDDGGE